MNLAKKRSVAPAAAEDVAALYDWLSRYSLWSNGFRGFRGDAMLTMHKALEIPADLRREYPPERAALFVVDEALRAAGLPKNPRVLDAGCGYGGTVFRWHGLAGGVYDGLTLSKVQWRIARREASRRKIETACHFHLASYDQPLPKTFDGIVSIESLIHSPDLDHTLRNLVAALEPGGKLILVEDTAVSRAGAEDARARLEHYWHLVSIPTRERYLDLFATLGLELEHEADFSSGFKTRDGAWLEEQRSKYRRIHRFLPMSGPRRILGAFRGGLAMEELYNQGALRYLLLVASKVR